MSLPKFQKGWFTKWLSGSKDLYEAETPAKVKVPKEVLEEFESVTDLGTRDIVLRGQVLRRVQLFACRNLR